MKSLMRWSRFGVFGGRDKSIASRSGSRRPRRFLPKFESLEERTQPAALSPCDFTSLGILNPSVIGTYVIDTTGPNPTLTGPGGTSFTGVVSGGVAVFDFDSVVIQNGVTIVASGPNPVAILSHTTMIISGILNGSGGAAGPNFSNPPPAQGGPGGGVGGDSFGSPGGGPGGGQAPTGSSAFVAGAGGGGFGGKGARGADENSPFFGSGTGGAGGVAYANLFTMLQGGSGGGGASDPLFGASTNGGAGGGTFELGAVASLTVSATGIIRVDGGNGGVGDLGASGGGSGGGVLMHAITVSMNGIISAKGGDGGAGGVAGDAGGGGGGEVAVIFATTGAFNNTGTINLLGGTSGVANPGPGGPFSHGGSGADPTGANGRLITRTAPPPASVILVSSPVKVLFPVRYAFDPRTGLYSGFLTIVNTGPVDITGPIAVGFTKFPHGVTVVNARLSVAIPPGGIFCGTGQPGGVTFINTTGSLIRGMGLRVFVQFTNPFHVSLSTFYHGPDYGLQFYQGRFV